ncbi:MAG: methyltransferase domain-containing protein [Phycisphaerae bacterium]|nr:methyltransferase domain-containing protein [Phycisphaerae bacterium]
MTTKKNDPRIRFFDDAAANWDAGRPHSDTDARIDDVSEQLRLQPGEEVLEIGCGTGQLTAWLVEQVGTGHVTAVDFSGQMLARARAKAIAAEFRKADACSDDFGRDRFDVVLCFHAFPHFRDQQAALVALGCAMKPDGRLVVMHWNSAAEINAFHDGLGGAVAGDHLPVGEAWTPLLAEAGLKAVRHIDQPGLFVLEARRR